MWYVFTEACDEALRGVAGSLTADDVRSGLRREQSGVKCTKCLRPVLEIGDDPQRARKLSLMQLLSDGAELPPCTCQSSLEVVA